MQVWWQCTFNKRKRLVPDVGRICSFRFSFESEITFLALLCNLCHWSVYAQSIMYTIIYGFWTLQGLSCRTFLADSFPAFCSLTLICVTYAVELMYPLYTYLLCNYLGWCPFPEGGEGVNSSSHLSEDVQWRNRSFCTFHLFIGSVSLRECYVGSVTWSIVNSSQNLVEMSVHILTFKSNEGKASF
jgi:hypothetical protein